MGFPFAPSAHPENLAEAWPDDAAAAVEDDLAGREAIGAHGRRACAFGLCRVRASGRMLASITSLLSFLPQLLVGGRR